MFCGWGRNVDCVDRPPIVGWGWNMDGTGDPPIPVKLVGGRFRLILRCAPPVNIPVACCASWDGNGLFGLTDSPENWLGAPRPVLVGSVGMLMGCVVAGDAYCRGREECRRGDDTPPTSSISRLGHHSC